ncbi:MAG: IPTL-CTERM sorting domain-containing protein [Comamonadaceae bacterium]|nr:IPTL-CTERM sorting domain-containing protein [Comamonadaceae bacterium]
MSFTITYPQTLPVGTRVYKYGPTTADASDHWHVLSHPSVSISGNRLTFTVTDNDKDSGDSNPADGFITDPVGVGVPALGSDATSIPTLSEWGAILLSGLLGLLGLARVRRQNS